MDEYSSNEGGNRDIYWATLDKEEIASQLAKHVDLWYENLGASGIYRKMRKSYAAYYGYNSTGAGHTSSEMIKTGEQGELTLIKANHFRNLLQHLLVMTTSSRPAMEARAVNTDYRSLAQTILANGILDYYMREKRLERYLKLAVEHALVFGEGYVRLEWDTTQGDEYSVDPESDKITFTGDINYSVLNPIDVIKDVFRTDNNDEDWIIIRHFKNRFELVAKYPELKEELLKAKTKDEMDMTFNYKFKSDGQLRSDLVPVYEFYHRRSDALPNGRQVVYVTKESVLYDGPLPYKNIPVYRIAPGDFIGTPHGYTVAFDLLSLQETLDGLYSIIITNQSTFGVQNLIIPQNHNISYSSLPGGLNVIEYDPSSGGKPEALNLTKTPPEIFQFVDKIESVMETISGVNSVARGNPEANLRSGNALALIQSMAIQFNSGLQQSFAQLLEDVGTATLSTLRDFAATPRVAMIAGKSNRSYMREFTGNDLDKVSRVVVDMGNPLSKCLKIDTEVLMHNGSIKKVQDIVTGEVIMGPDSKIRTVESVSIGQEEMFDISHSKINSEFVYGCNKSHILSLKYCSNDGRYGLKQYDIVDISVGEFLLWPKGKQQKFMGFRTGVEFETKPVTVPAYQLGLWLGDGHQNTTAITTMDEEIRQEWYNYAKVIGHDIRVQSQPNNQSSVYFITSGESHGSNDRNNALNAFRDLGVINNKHIPQSYKINSAENRLELLAGLLDTDGSLVSKTTFVITQKNKQLSKDIIYLARSLGFRVTTKEIKSKSQNGTEGLYQKITIGGDTWTIPTRIARKRAIKKTKARNHLNYSIDIKSTGMGTYYGFTLKEEPHFVLGDFTVTHNTTAGKLEMANNLLQQGIIKNAQDYIMVMKTGNLDQMLEGDLSELTLIKGENEKLAEGKGVSVTVLDEHVLHIKEHKTVIASPDARENAEVTQAVLQHIQDHIQQLKTADPALLNILGQPSLAPPPQPPGPGGPEGAEAPGGPSMGGPTPPSPTEGPQAPVPEGAPNITMPSLPKNPMDNQVPEISGVNK